MYAIGIGDLHLTSMYGNGAWSRYFQGNSDKAILLEAQKAVDYGLKNGITRVFLYGDICDSPKMSYQAHEALFEFFTKNSQCKFYVILGNHDMVVSGSSQHSLSLLKTFHSALPNVRIIEKPTSIRIEGALVRFLPYPSADFKADALNVCHLDVAGSTLDSGIKSKSQVDPKNYIIVSGHIHTQDHFKNCYYSGSLIQTNFGESQNKCFHLIDFKSIKDYEIISIPLHLDFQLRSAVIKNQDDLDKIVKENKDAKESIVWRFIVSDGCNADFDSLSLSKELNIAQVKSYKTKQDLQNLACGSIDYVSVNDIRPEDVFVEMLNARPDIDSNMKKQIIDVRKKVLKPLCFSAD